LSPTATMAPAPTETRLSADERKAIEAYSAQAWLLSIGAMTNKGKPMEWEDRLWMHQILVDQTPEKVVRKASQVGMSTCEIFTILHKAVHDNISAIYILPDDKLVSSFVRSKVNPIMTFNSIPTADADSIEMKSIGDKTHRSFLFFQGSWTEREAISIDADILVFDEMDFCKQEVLVNYESRINASDLAWMHRFSTPTAPNQCIDFHFQRSDQKHWFVKCSSCGYEWYLDWPENVCYERGVFQCSRCHAELTRESRRGGRWVNKWANRPISGYWVSQMSCAWVEATKLIDIEQRLGKQYLFNYCLGKGYAGSDITVSEGLITHALRNGVPEKMDGLCIGIDVHSREHHYTVGPQAGITEMGSFLFDPEDPAAGFDKIENLIRHHNPETVVIDGNPHTNKSRALAATFPYKVYLSFFRPQDKSPDPYDFDDVKFNVISDRHLLISKTVEDFNAGRIELYVDPKDSSFKTYKRHWGNMFLKTETDKDSVERQVWDNGGNADHFALATCYRQLALRRYQFADPNLKTGKTEEEVLAKKDPGWSNGSIMPDITEDEDNAWYYG